MALSFRVSWVCALLFCPCLWFHPQTGCSAAPGFSLEEDGFSSSAGDVVDPQTSTQFDSGADQDPVHSSSETLDLWHQSEAAHHVASVTGPGEDEPVQSESEFQQNGTIPLPFLKYEQLSSNDPHPFDIFVNDHKSKQAVEGVNFPAISDLKRFIGAMKRSYLMPESDMRSSSPTNELATSGAQTIKWESSEEGSGSSVFEQNNYKMPSRSLGVTYGPGPDLQSPNYIGEDSSFEASVSQPKPPAAQDPDYFSNEISNIILTPEQKIQEPTFTSSSQDSQNPSEGSDLSKMRSSSYARRFYVPAPIVQRLSDPLPPRWEKTGPLIQRPQPTVGKESKDLNWEEPAVHLPVRVPVSFNGNLLSPWSSSGHVGVQPNRPQKPDLPEEAVVSANQQPNHRTENAPTHVSTGLAVSFNSLNKLAPTLKAEVLTNIVDDLSRISKNKKRSSDKSTSGKAAVRKSDLFPAPRLDVSLNEYGAPRGGFRHSFKQQKQSAKVNKESLNLPPVSKVVGSTLSNVPGRSDRNGKRPLQTGPNLPLTSVNTYVKSRGSYVRRKVSRSKSLYTPHLLPEGEAGTSRNLPDDKV